MDLIFINCLKIDVVFKNAMQNKQKKTSIFIFSIDFFGGCDNMRLIKVRIIN